MSANFTPSQSAIQDLKPFRFWCQKVLPTVYDDSLSYYELLTKVVNYLNDTIDNVETLNDNVQNIYDAYVLLQNYVNDYFDNNLPQLVSDKLDEMAEDGTLTALISAYIDPYFEEKSDEIDEAIESQNATISEAISDQNDVLSAQTNSINQLTSRMDAFVNQHSGLSGETLLYDGNGTPAYTTGSYLALSDALANYKYLRFVWKHRGEVCVQDFEIDTEEIPAQNYNLRDTISAPPADSSGSASWEMCNIVVINATSGSTNQLELGGATVIDNFGYNDGPVDGTMNTGILKVIGVRDVSDTEVVDARVGADGTIYPNLEARLNAENSELKNAVNDTQDWLGYPKNLFDAEFITTNTSNWGVEQTGNDVTFTHRTQWETGVPRTNALDIVAGTYNFSANYNGSARGLALYNFDNSTSTYIKALSETDVLTLEEGHEYCLYLGVIPSQGNSITISDISITAIETTGKIPDIESNISALQSSESSTAQTVAGLQSGFNSIAQPIISTLTGEETQSKAISANGTLITAGASTYRVCKYTVTVGKKYWITATANYANLLWCFYASDDSVVQTGTAAASGSSFTTVTDTEVTAPVNSAYIIIAYQTNIKQGALKTQTGYKTAKWLGKKWVCVGDSLTAENIRTTKHYFEYVSEETGITTVNMGVSGSGYARMSESNQAFYQRINSCPTDADVVTIFGSFNDLGAGLPIGSVNDTGTDTLAGCINTTITNLQTIIPLVNLGIVSPTPWDSTQPTTSGNAYNYVEMLKAICERRSIPFLDLWRCSNLRPWDADFRTVAYSRDNGSGTHPDENGHKLIAPRFEGFLDTLLLD